MDKLILATGNQGKITELRYLLSPIHCIPQQKLNISDAEETGLSFIENAIIKARHASLLGGLPALADDSGLVVHALNGEPGIYSARYSGKNTSSSNNIALLLKRLANIPDDKRQAYFYCALALLQHPRDPAPMIAFGRLDGIIAFKPQGHFGFGYDPVFYLPDYKCTLAELKPEIKNTLSHRARALKSLELVLHKEFLK